MTVKVEYEGLKVEVRGLSKGTKVIIYREGKKIREEVI